MTATGQGLESMGYFEKRQPTTEAQYFLKVEGNT